MKKLHLLFCACILLLSLGCKNKRPGKPRVLVFSKTAGYRHASIEVGKLAIMKLGQENGFLVDTTEDAAYFNEDSLKNYSAVIFLSTTGNVLNAAQEAAFERYIQAGGGYVGVHSATDTEYDWGWYGRLAGAYFLSHPAQQEAKFIIVDSTHISTKHLHSPWVRKDELYNYKKLNPDVHVLIKLDEKSYTGGANGDNHPIAWYHEYDGGRAFYTGLGHTDESYSEENFLKHLLGGIEYAIGDNLELDYSKATSQIPPLEDRFTKVSLVQGMFYEPTEMTVLPNLDILVAQRRGELMLYKQNSKTVKQVGFLNVYHHATVPNVNAEEGFLGIKADPDFANNHFIYLFYSPFDTSVNRLSRFKFENDTLDMSSEKVVLQFHSDRNICCHTGGSIDFAGDGKTLFVSTGDNSTPFDEPGQPYVSHGFAPLDDRPGHEQYDARRTAANTNDLRGKILRIIINPDGTYSIPEGNLFPKGTPKTRPEIYVMGDRNPYRIMVDKKTGYLYWGEVGPDAANDSFKTRGPRGYDEVNQARKAGFFGWPLFVGNNYAYHEYAYGTGETKPMFDSARPQNTSRNNTGLQSLPPAQPAFIWYPYAASPDFPQVGTGGRNAMAGPVYYTDMFPADTRLPDYYNKKLFIYDWIRGWIKVVTMRPNGDFDKMEPFMEHMKLSNLIDMEVGPDGKLYLLEYGTGWFQKNPDAGLSRIDYNGGNLSPKVSNLTVNKTSGVLPLTIKASVDAVDLEKDKLTYTWHIGDSTKETTEPRLEYTISKAGDYPVSVVVSDDKKASTKSEVIGVYAGNEAPTVAIAIAGNQTFYFPGKPVSYSVKVEDKDDPSQPDMSNLVVSADYLEGSDRAAANMGHQILTEAMMGKNLMLSLDCKTCHKESEKSIGPAYTDVAKKYENDERANNYLVDKILKGGSGVWGEVNMPAHPNLPRDEARQIVQWIQSLTEQPETKKSLPPSGTVQPTLGKPAKDNGVLYISAAYTDKGGDNIRPLSANAVYALRNSKISFGDVDSVQGFTTFGRNGTHFMVAPTSFGWFALKNIDLTSISSATIQMGWLEAPDFGYTLELRLDASDGQKLASFDVKPTSATSKGGPVMVSLKAKMAPVTDGKKHNLFIVSTPKDPKEQKRVAVQSIEFR
jgi:glucose/arabinose dehydrogenase/cytochrome c551/c552/type 1 glutamine amidotransferase